MYHVSRAASCAIRADGTRDGAEPAPPGETTDFVLTPAPAPLSVALENVKK